MRTLFFNAVLTAISIATFATGCSQSDRFLRADLSSIEVAAGNTSDIPLTVSSSAPWMVDVASQVDWLYTRYSSEDANLLWVSAMSRNESLTDRSTSIVLASGDGLVLSIPFRQLAMEARFDVSPRTLDPFAARDAATRILTVDTDLSWTSSSLHDDWILLTRGTDDDPSANTLSVTVKPTRLLDERRDTIVLRPATEAFSSLADSVAVVQRGADLVLFSDGFMDDDTFEFSVPAAGAQVPLTLFSRSSWSLSCSVPTETVSFDLTEGDPDIENGINIVMTVGVNAGLEPFVFTFTFSGGGEQYTYRCTQQTTGT